MTGWLLDIWCCNSVINSPDTDMLIIWHWHVILDTWSLTLDIWHRHLSCYTWHMIPDTWYLTPVLDMLSLKTWYLTPDIWHLTIDMLSLTWHAFTWYYYIWPDIMTPDWILLLLTPVHHFYGDLAWLLYYYQIFGTPELLYSYILEPWSRVAPDITPDIILLLTPVIG